MTYKVCKRQGYIDKVDCVENESDTHKFFDSIIEANQFADEVKLNNQSRYLRITLFRPDLADCVQFRSVEELEQAVESERIDLYKEIILIDTAHDMHQFLTNRISEENNFSVISRMKKYIDVLHQNTQTH
jgi:hypothetical protein